MTGHEVPPFPTHPAKRVTVLLGTRHRAGHHSLMIELVKRARRAKLAGITVLPGQSGYGASGRVHRSHLMTGDVPLSVIAVDGPGRVEAYLRDVSALVQDVLVVVDDVDVVEL